MGETSFASAVFTLSTSPSRFKKFNFFMCDHYEQAETDPAGRSFCGSCGEILDCSTSLTLAGTDSSQFHSLKMGCIAEKDNFREYKEYLVDKRFQEVSTAGFRAAGMYFDDLSRSQVMRILRDCEERNIRGNRDNLILAASFIVSRDRGSAVDVNTYSTNVLVHAHILKRWILKITRDSPLCISPPDTEQVVHNHLSNLSSHFDIHNSSIIPRTLGVIALMTKRGELQSSNLVPGSLAVLVAVLQSSGVKIKLCLAVSACGQKGQKTLCYGKFKLAKEYLK